MAEVVANYLAELCSAVRASESPWCWKGTDLLFLLFCIRIKHKLKTGQGLRKGTGKDGGGMLLSTPIRTRHET